MLSSFVVGSLLLMAVLADPEGHGRRKHRHRRHRRCCLPPPFFPPVPPLAGGVEAGFVASPGSPPLPFPQQQQQLRQRQVQQPIKRQIRPFPTRTLHFTTTIRTTVATPFVTTVFAPAAAPAPGYAAPAPTPCVCICGAVGETKVGSGQIVFQCQQQQQQQQGGPGGCPMCPQQGQIPGKAVIAQPGQAKVEPGVSPCPQLGPEILEAQREQIKELQQAAAGQGAPVQAGFCPEQQQQQGLPGQKQMGQYPYGYPYRYPYQYPGQKGRAGPYPVYPSAKQLQREYLGTGYYQPGGAPGGYYGQQAGGPGRYYQQGPQGGQGVAPGGGYYQQGGQGGQGGAPGGGYYGQQQPGDYYGQGGQWQGYYGETQPTPCTTTEELKASTSETTSCTTTTTETESEESETESTTTSTGEAEDDEDMKAKSNWAAEQSGPNLGLIVCLMVASFSLITIM